MNKKYMRQIKNKLFLKQLDLNDKDIFVQYIPYARLSKPLKDYDMLLKKLGDIDQKMKDKLNILKLKSEHKNKGCQNENNQYGRNRQKRMEKRQKKTKEEKLKAP